MMDALASRSWTFLVRGIVAILFGIAALIWPGITIVTLTMLFGAFAFVDGIFALTAALGGFGGSRWWALLLEGIIGLLVAFFVYTQPAMSMLSLIYAAGFWAVLTGIVEIVAGLQLREVISNEWLYVFAGILSIVFGVLVVRDPAAGAMAIIWMLAVYAILFGLLELSLSYRLSHVRSLTPKVHAP